MEVTLRVDNLNLHNPFSGVVGLDQEGAPVLRADYTIHLQYQHVNVAFCLFKEGNIKADWGKNMLFGWAVAIHGGTFTLPDEKPWEVYENQIIFLILHTPIKLCHTSNNLTSLRESWKAALFPERMFISYGSIPKKIIEADGEVVYPDGTIEFFKIQWLYPNYVIGKNNKITVTAGK